MRRPFASTRAISVALWSSEGEGRGYRRAGGENVPWSPESGCSRTNRVPLRPGSSYLALAIGLGGIYYRGMGIDEGGERWR